MIGEVLGWISVYKKPAEISVKRIHPVGDEGLLRGCFVHILLYALILLFRVKAYCDTVVGIVSCPATVPVFNSHVDNDI